MCIVCVVLLIVKSCLRCCCDGRVDSDFFDSLRFARFHNPLFLSGLVSLHCEASCVEINTVNDKRTENKHVMCDMSFLIELIYFIKIVHPVNDLKQKKNIFRRTLIKYKFL